MNFTIDTRDLERTRRSFSAFSDRRFAAAMAEGLFNLGREVQRAERAEMRDVFDRITPFTEGQVYIDRGTAAQPRVEVGVADSPYSRGYLKPQIFGGIRSRKRFEKLLIYAGAMRATDYAVPGRFAKLDAFGNISPGQLRQILSQLRIEPTQGATSALPVLEGGDRDILRRTGNKARGLSPADRSRLLGARQKRNRINAAYRKAGGQFIAVPERRGKLRPGIYQVRQFAAGRASPRPVLAFVRGVRYEAERFDFFYVGERAVRANASRAIGAALANQLRRWAQKYGA